MVSTYCILPKYACIICCVDACIFFSKEKLQTDDKKERNRLLKECDDNASDTVDYLPETCVKSE